MPKVQRVDITAIVKGVVGFVMGIVPIFSHLVTIVAQAKSHSVVFLSEGGRRKWFEMVQLVVNFKKVL